MALNPEIVADVLFLSLNRNLVGDWYRGGVTPRAIEEKARQRATSPNSFADWLIVQDFFRLRHGVDIDAFRADIQQQLRRADLTQIPESIRHTHHRILYMESNADLVDPVQGYIELMATREYGIPIAQIQFDHLEYPPEASVFITLLEEHTCSILHNLSLGDLEIIEQAVQKNPNLAPKIVIVRTGSVMTDQLREIYQNLTDLGLMVIGKPYPSMEEVTRVALGIV